MLNLIEFPSTKSSEKWLSEFCTTNKQNKTYSLRSLIEEEFSHIQGINYDDLWISEASSDPYADLSKSMRFIDSNNEKVFELLWKDVSVESLKQFIQDVTKNGKI